MSFDDELQRSLQGLDADLYAAKMPGPAAARKRAAQRTRNKVMGTVLGGVAAVAAGAVIVLQPFMPAANEGPPAITPTPTETETQEPTNEPTEIVSDIPDAALMIAGDISDENLSDWQETDTENRPGCHPSIGNFDGFVERKQATYRHPVGGVDGDAYYSHDVILTEPDSTEDVFALLKDFVIECVPNSERDADGNAIMPFFQSGGFLTNVGDGGYLFDYMEASDEEFSATLVDVSLVRKDTAISIVSRWYVGQDEIGGPDLQTPANAADRMCQAMFDESCVTGTPGYEPEVRDEPTGDPDPTSGGNEDDVLELAAEPFLTEDQINPVGYVDSNFAENPNPAADTSDMAAGFCLDDPRGVRADDVRALYWASDVEGDVSETVLQFPDAGSAAEWLDDYTNIVDRCAAMGVEIVTGDNAGPREINQLTIDLDNGSDALGWEIFGHGGGETGTYFLGAAVATRGNIGIIMTFSAISPPDDWAAYATEKLPLALGQATE